MFVIIHVKRKNSKQLRIVGFYVYFLDFHCEFYKKTWKHFSLVFFFIKNENKLPRLYVIDYDVHVVLQVTIVNDIEQNEIVTNEDEKEKARR